MLASACAPADRSANPGQGVDTAAAVDSEPTVAVQPDPPSPPPGGDTVTATRPTPRTAGVPAGGTTAPTRAVPSRPRPGNDDPPTPPPPPPPDPDGTDIDTTPSPRPAPSVLAGLDSSAVRLEADRELLVRHPATFVLRVARRAALPAAASSRRRTRADTTLLVGDSARACLTVPGDWEFASGTPPCRSQVVAPGSDNVWQWSVTPARAADSLPVSASLTAILPGRGAKEFYSGTLTVHVGVEPCPLWRGACLAAAVSTWQGIIVGFGATLASAGGMWATLRGRRRRRAARSGVPRRPIRVAGHD